ncbi:HD domain-containing protein [Falsibacillus albus]|uniref:HD domain-containing protein n=1 Tax=Falsibacillus albus TaxID=2478915 RepID=UPI0013147CE4|nr:HD domain-containing protein [Falsibacillus albus]
MHLIQKARDFAFTAHLGQKRRLSDEPYFVHAENVARLLEESGLSKECIAAGYLHDVVEDTPITMDEITNVFGDKVSMLVKANTEDKSLNWEARKLHTINSIKTASFEEKALITADKLDNASSLLKHHERLGDEMWSSFKRGKAQQVWYYQQIGEQLEKYRKHDEPSDLLEEFLKVLAKLKKLS